MLSCSKIGKSINRITRNMRYLVLYLVLINLLVLSFGIVLHEFGHVVTGGILGCVGETGMGDLLNPAVPGFFTSLSCPVSVEQNIVLLLGLGGFIFLIPFALMFLSIHKRPEKNLSIVLLGYAVILAGLDLLMLFSNDIIVYVSLFLGVAAMSAGEVLLATDYTDYLDHVKSAKLTANKMSKRNIHTTRK